MPCLVLLLCCLCVQSEEESSALALALADKEQALAEVRVGCVCNKSVKGLHVFLGQSESAVPAP